MQRAEDLAELEKQVIAATWKVMRRETAEKPGDQFVPDVKLIQDSQNSAEEQGTALGDRLTDERSQGYLKNVITDMTAAADHLQESQDGPSAKPLELALASEQAAYQDILRMRQRESEVVRANRQQGQQANQNSRTARQQRQLDQLDLANQDNRYQAQRNAQQQQDQQNQDPAQRETRQVVSRLRELAQRQEDINRQMRRPGGPAACSAAFKTRAAWRRHAPWLASLRDQQQQQLRDTDELRNRMDQPQNQERMANERGQLDDTRNNIQRTGEQLNRGQVAEAQASGQRAAEQLNQLRDEVRQQAAGQFADSMTQMRQDAQKLDENQQQLSGRLAQLDQQAQLPAAGLRPNSGQERQQVAQGLQNQKQDLNKLMDNMRQNGRAGRSQRAAALSPIGCTTRCGRPRSSSRTRPSTPATPARAAGAPPPKPARLRAMRARVFRSFARAWSRRRRASWAMKPRRSAGRGRSSINWPSR